MPSRLFSLRLMFGRSKLESLCDVSVTRIGDAFSYGFPQNALKITDPVGLMSLFQLLVQLLLDDYAKDGGPEAV